MNVAATPPRRQPVRRLSIPTTPAHTAFPRHLELSTARLTVLGLPLGLATIGGLGWAGLRVQPAPFPAVPRPSTTPASIPLPRDLPAPVERLYRQTYGQQVPVIHSAVLSGRGALRLFGLTFPMRFRFIHEATRTFRAYFELTAFGQPLIRANEHYRDGRFRQELPVGIAEGEPKLDHSACLRMWAEWAQWAPALLLTDPQARWEPIDDATALLVVPCGAEEEHLIVRFAPTTGTVAYVEAMKYKTARDTSKTLWINAVWFGERPWAEFSVEDTAYNVDVDTSWAARGP